VLGFNTFRQEPGSRRITVRVLTLSIASLTACLVVTAQQPKTFASAADVQALAEKAKQTRKANQPTVSQPILQLAPYSANLESRNAVGPASIHEKEAEMFYVIDGSATLVTGGKLVNETRNGDNLSGTAIEGGTPRQVAKGDFVMVPEKTAHWFSKIDGTLQLMSIHLPHESK
jgi:mannose-6-phosphate isomerase-like protein (cupin superfamily)